MYPIAEERVSDPAIVVVLALLVVTLLITCFILLYCVITRKDKRPNPYAQRHLDTGVSYDLPSMVSKKISEFAYH